MTKDKRGQAALEFLTTYGWAFLVILIMISALAYFGVLNPSQFLPERCNMAKEFSCRDYKVTEVTPGEELAFNLSVVNQVGNSVEINGANVSTSNPEIDSSSCNIPSESISQRAGATIECTITGSFPAAGNKQRIPFQIRYQEVGGQFEHTIQGEVLANIQES